MRTGPLRVWQHGSSVCRSLLIYIPLTPLHEQASESDQHGFSYAPKHLNLYGMQ